MNHYKIASYIMFGIMILCFAYVNKQSVLFIEKENKLINELKSKDSIIHYQDSINYQWYLRDSAFKMTLGKIKH